MADSSGRDGKRAANVGELKKVWTTPDVITSELRDTEVKGGAFPDSHTLSFSFGS